MQGFFFLLIPDKKLSNFSEHGFKVAHEKCSLLYLPYPHVMYNRDKGWVFTAGRAENLYGKGWTGDEPNTRLLPGCFRIYLDIYLGWLKQI